DGKAKRSSHEGEIFWRRASRNCHVSVVAQFTEKVVKILRIAEIAIDRSKTNITDIIERLQRLHDETADLVGADLEFAAALELPHNPRHGALDAIGIDIALAQRDIEGPHELVAVKRHLAARAFDHDQLAQLDALEGGKPPAADGTDPATPDRAAILDGARILDLGVFRLTIGAAHPAAYPR